MPSQCPDIAINPYVPHFPKKICRTKVQTFTDQCIYKPSDVQGILPLIQPRQLEWPVLFDKKKTWKFHNPLSNLTSSLLSRICIFFPQLCICISYPKYSQFLCFCSTSCVRWVTVYQMQICILFCCALFCCGHFIIFILFIINPYFRVASWWYACSRASKVTLKQGTFCACALPMRDDVTM